MEAGRAQPHPFTHPTYLIRRKVFKIFGGAFHVYAPDGTLALYTKLKAFKLKEDIRLYADEEMRTELLSIQARQVIDWGASYDVYDSVAGVKVGALRRKGFKSMFKDEWLVLDPYDREIGLICEDGVLLAMVRRFLTNLIPQKFHMDLGGVQVATYRQNFNPFVQKVTMDFTPDVQGYLDRRLGIAAGVLLCAIEGRQVS